MHLAEPEECLAACAVWNSTSKQWDFSTGLDVSDAWDPSLDPSSAAKEPSSSIPSATKAWEHVSYLSGHTL